MTSNQKIVQHLTEAHATESALIQTLTAHIAMTPRGEYRNLLERHLRETREQDERILRRLSELGAGKNPVQIAYGVAQTAIGQLMAAGMVPLNLLRGTSGEEKLLKNAKDEASTEALEIATYDALEALATAAGDEKTAVLAREHRQQEETFLAQLREVIRDLARAVHGAETEGDSTFKVSETGAADAARVVAKTVRDAAPSGDAGSEPSEDEEPSEPTRAARPQPAAQERNGSADLPIEDYDELPVDQIVPRLRLLTSSQLIRVEEYEQANRARKRILDRVAKLRQSTNGRAPAAAPGR